MGPSFTLPFLAAVLLLGSGAAAPHPTEEAAQPRAASTPPLTTQLQVHFLDVGTGDCIWIRTGDDGIVSNGQLEGFNLVIDGGDAPSFGRVDGYKAASAYLQEDDRLPKDGSMFCWQYQ